MSGKNGNGKQPTKSSLEKEVKKLRRLLTSEQKKASEAEKTAAEAQKTAVKAQMKGNGTGYPTGRGPKSAFGKLILRHCKHKVWRIAKFVPVNVDQEAKLWKIILKSLQGDGVDEGYKTPAEKARWVVLHARNCARAMNETRQYVVGRLKEAVKKYWKANGKVMPSLENIKAIATRSLPIDDGNTDNMALAKWYVDSYMVAACGNRYDFGPSARHYHPLSLACPEDDSKKPTITASTEAFAVICLENNYTSWPAVFEIEEQYPGYEIRRAHKNMPDGYVPGSTHTLLEDGNVRAVYVHGDQFNTKWTMATEGAKKEGGWSPEGRDEFTTLNETIHNIRTSDDTKEASLAYEHQILAALRIDYKLSAESEGLEKALGSKRAPEQLPKKAELIDFGDDDSDCDMVHFEAQRLEGEVVAGIDEAGEMNVAAV